jgi:hypothetical protein
VVDQGDAAHARGRQVQGRGRAQPAVQSCRQYAQGFDRPRGKETTRRDLR